MDAPKHRFAKIFANGQSQAVRLPKEFRFEGDRVRVRRVGDGLLLQPVVLDVRKYFDAIDSRAAGADFMANGREQPSMPEEDDSFD
jgi:antitoxin VapB